MIEATIEPSDNYRYLVLEFRDTLVVPEHWVFSISFQPTIIHDQLYFLLLDGDIDYEEDEIEPPSTIEQMVQDVIRMRWPVPFPHHLMIAAAKDAWDQIQ